MPSCNATNSAFGSYIIIIFSQHTHVMKLIAVLLASLLVLTSCGDDTTTNTTTTPAKPWVEIRPDSINGITNVGYEFFARVNNFDQDELRLLWYFGEGDTIQVDKNTYWNNEVYHRFTAPGIYTISVTAMDMFADTVIAKGTTIATITN
jgi:hypothetical protein